MMLRSFLGGLHALISNPSIKKIVDPKRTVLRRPPKKPVEKEADEVDTTTTISQASVTSLEYTTQTSTNSWKTAKTVAATISAASSTLEGLVQTICNSYGNNKVPSIL